MNEARMEQIFTKAKDVLNEVEAFELPGGVVLTGGAASLPGVVDLAQEIFDTTVKLYVPNHMGLRNPVFTNVISLVDYAANLGDVYRAANAAVTGEKLTKTVKAAVKEAPVKETPKQEEPKETPVYQDVEESKQDNESI